MSHIKVAYMFGQLNRGGAETLVLDVCAHSAVLPFTPMLIHRNGGVLGTDFARTEVQMYKLSPRRGKYISYILALRHLLLRNNVTVVHAQQSLDGVFAKIATIGTGIKVVVTFHGFDFRENKLSKCFHWLALRLCDTACFVSKCQRDYYLESYKIQSRRQRTCFIYDGVDFRKLDKLYDAPNDIISNNRVKLVMVGNFMRGRDQYQICRSLKRVKEQTNNFDFYFVGRRTKGVEYLYDNCIRYIKENDLDENVHILGERSDVPAILQQMEGFVYASNCDTFGIAIVEAMAVGLPVVVNDWAVMKEITNNGEWATIYTTEDIEDCADKIVDLIEHIDTYHAKAQMLKPIVRKAYSIEQHIEQLNLMYSR